MTFKWKALNPDEEGRMVETCVCDISFASFERDDQVIFTFDISAMRNSGNKDICCTNISQKDAKLLVYKLATELAAFDPKFKDIIKEVIEI